MASEANENTMTSQGLAQAPQGLMFRNGGVVFMQSFWILDRKIVGLPKVPEVWGP